MCASLVLAIDSFVRIPRLANSFIKSNVISKRNYVLIVVVHQHHSKYMTWLQYIICLNLRYIHINDLYNIDSDPCVYQTSWNFINVEESGCFLFHSNVSFLWDRDIYCDILIITLKSNINWEVWLQICMKHTISI